MVRVSEAVKVLRQTKEPTPVDQDAAIVAATAEAAAKLLETKLAIGAEHAAALVTLNKQRNEKMFLARDTRDVTLAVLAHKKKTAICALLAAGLVLTAIKAEQDRATKAHRTDTPAKFSLSP